MAADPAGLRNTEQIRSANPSASKKSTKYPLSIPLIASSTGGVRDGLGVLADVLDHALDQLAGGDHQE